MTDERKLTAREKAEAYARDAEARYRNPPPMALFGPLEDAYLAGYRQAVEDSAKVAEKHARNFEAGQGKWASNDIADQIRKLAGRED